jgi:hypothetical protein
MHEWAPYSIAGAFMVGTVVGFVAAVRVVRLVADYFRKRNV